MAAWYSYADSAGVLLVMQLVLMAKEVRRKNARAFFSERMMLIRA